MYAFVLVIVAIGAYVQDLVVLPAALVQNTIQHIGTASCYCTVCMQALAV